MEVASGRVAQFFVFIVPGGGVTVRYGHHLLNLLTVRRARPRLLVQDPEGTTFHPDVAMVGMCISELVFGGSGMCILIYTHYETRYVVHQTAQ